MANLDTKSIKTLKRMAKIIMEERAEVKPHTSYNAETGEETTLYEVEINRKKGSIT